MAKSLQCLGAALDALRWRLSRRESEIMAQVDLFGGSHDMRQESRCFASEACGETFDMVVEDRTAPRWSGRTPSVNGECRKVTRDMFTFDRNEALVARKYEGSYTSSPTPHQTRSATVAEQRRMPPKLCAGCSTFPGTEDMHKEWIVRRFQHMSSNAA